jgi:aldose 1-epimerase
MEHVPTSRPFSTLPTGEPVKLWTLRGRGGLTLEAMTYGGIVTRLVLPDGTDVVLGFDYLAPYLAGHTFFGAITGRVAGRITGAQFTIDGITTHLTANEAGNNLHGGPIGFDKRIWHATPITRPDGAPSLRLYLISTDSDQGFPGELNVTIDYTVTDDNAFLIETTTNTTKPTTVSLTHHGYFNLGGHQSGNMLDHTLQINANRYVPTTENFTLLDRLELVDTATDLRKPQPLREAVQHFPGEHGALYATQTQEAQREPIHIARLQHTASGRMLDCYTNAPFLQVYTASHLGGPIAGKSGAIYRKFAGICLECESYANGANAPHMGPHSILRPGETQRFTTAYKFSSATGGF